VTADTPRSRLAERSRNATLNAARKANRRRAVPRWATTALKASAVLLPVAAVAGMAVWGWTSGALPAAYARAEAGFIAASADAGLTVQEVFVQGRKEAAPDALLTAVGVTRGDPILAFDPHAAQQRLEAIPWVASATVERRLPDTIFVSIVERTPMAVWQVDRRLRLVDADGVVLTEENLTRWADLPMLVGENAPARGKDLLQLLASEPLIGEQVEAAVLVGGRRWDLRLKNGVDIRLPETEVGAALRQLAMVQQTNRVLEKDIVAVDLRMPDRLVVQTSAEAAAARRKPADKKRRI